MLLLLFGCGEKAIPRAFGRQAVFTLWGFIVQMLSTSCHDLELELIF